METLYTLNPVRKPVIDLSTTKIDILIPSCKDISIVEPLAKSIKETTNNDNCNFIYTADKVSAPVNRNACMWQSAKTQAEYVIMIDDDIEGFYFGWESDLLTPLQDKNIILSTPWLWGKSGRCAIYTSGAKSYTNTNTGATISCRTPTTSAVMAFRKADVITAGMRFDEDFVGSGYEDTLFMSMLLHKYNTKYFAIAESCKLTHRNERKCQDRDTLEHNRKLFFKKMQEHGIDY